MNKLILILVWNLGLILLGSDSGVCKENSLKYHKLSKLKRIIPEVEPLNHHGVIYKVSLKKGESSSDSSASQQSGGSIVAIDSETKVELWHIQVYKTEFNKFLDRDIQEVYIEKITPSQQDPKVINVIDENLVSM